jgi:glycosyltransferase involved in cell wall biosynthesis
MQHALVSIVTISKNNIKGLYKTLESVKEQDYAAIQHVVIDGDSQDGSKEFLKHYSHSKSYLYYSEPDRGISNAFNKGIARSIGELIFFLNAGDILLSPFIVSEVVTSYLNFRWQCASGRIISSDYSGKEVLYTPPQLSTRFLKYFMFLPHQGFFCKSTLHKQYRFDESIKTSMDYDLFIRMLKGIEIFYLPTVVAKCEPGGISSQSRRRIIEQSRIRMKHATKVSDKVIVNFINSLILLKDFLKVDSPFAKR